MPSLATILLVLVVISLFLYIRQNDKKIMHLPADVEAISGKKLTKEVIQATAQELAASPIAVTSMLPPKTGRRYIVVGGGGFLGSWIITHLLQRGEDPKRIRVVDLRPPSRPELSVGLAKDIEFVRADITDAGSVRLAFTRPWPQTESPDPDITVFHTAAIVRFWERHPSLVPLSAKVNVIGLQNVIDASRACGATILCSTSSGSVGIKATRFLLLPWEKQPDQDIQILRDDADYSSKPHHHYFSNYAYTKYQGERLVCSADQSPSAGGRILRTGCIRPGNGIYGVDDLFCGLYLRMEKVTTWVSNTCHNFIYVENCSLAHLCYEQRLLELARGSKNPDIGGKAFIATDAGPPVLYGDAYSILNVLTGGRTVFTTRSATGLLLLAYLLEAYYLFVEPLHTSTSGLFKALSNLFPRIKGELFFLQPSLFNMMSVHLIFDGSGATAPPEKGGLGYTPPWTTLTGLCKMVADFEKNKKCAEGHVDGGSGPLSGLARAECSIQNGIEKLEALGMHPEKVLN